jgi:hypothetical protein
MPPPAGPPWAGGPGGPAGPGGPQQPPGKGWKHSRRLRWGAGIAAVALLAAGGTAAGLELTGTPANAAQAVALNAALTAPGRGCPGPAGTQGKGAHGSSAHRNSAKGNSAKGNGTKGAGTGHRRCLRRRLREIKGMYGEAAFHTANGTQTLAFERGTVASASSGKLTVHAPDGTQWTWTLSSNSMIRKSGQTIPASQLTGGTRVFVGGQVTGSSRDARLVFVRPPKNTRGGHSPGQSGAGSSGSSASGT